MHHEEGEAGQLDPWTPGSWLTGQPRRWALSHMNIPQLGQGRLDDNGTNPKTTSFLFFFFFWFLFFSFFSDNVPGSPVQGCHLHALCPISEAQWGNSDGRRRWGCFPERRVH